MVDLDDVMKLPMHIENNVTFKGSVDDVKKTFATLEKQMLSMHCLIHAMYSQHTTQVGSMRWSLNSLYFDISFVGNDGLVDSSAAGVLVTGIVMSSFITKKGKGPKSKPRYVYDCTGGQSLPLTQE